MPVINLWGFSVQPIEFRDAEIDNGELIVRLQLKYA